MPPAGRGASGACCPRGTSALPLPRWGLFVFGGSQEASLRYAPLLRLGTAVVGRGAPGRRSAMGESGGDGRSGHGVMAGVRADGSR
jgi:hypothetical protein